MASGAQPAIVPPALPRTPNNPFEDEDVVIRNPRVRNTYRALEDCPALVRKWRHLANASSMTSTEEVEEWYGDAKKEATMLDKESDRLAEVVEQMEQDGDVWNNGASDIQADAEQVISDSDACRTRNSEARIELNTLLPTTIKQLFSVYSKGEVLATVSDLCAGVEPQYPDLDKVPQELFKSIKENLPGAPQSDEITTAELCEFIKSVAISIKKMGKTKVKTQILDSQPRDSSSEPESLRTSLGSQLLSPRKQNPGKRLKIADVGPRKRRAEEHLPTIDEDGDATPQEMVELQQDLDALTIEHQWLVDENREQVVEIGHLSRERTQLQGRLFSNAINQGQAAPEFLQNWAVLLQEAFPPPSRPVPAFLIKNCVLLANDFHGLPSRPIECSPLHYLLALNDDIRYEDDSDRLGRVVSASLPWLSTRISQIVKFSISHKEVNLLFYYLRAILTVRTPNGLGRAALFMILAQLAERSFEFAGSVFWKEQIHEIVESQHLGKPLVDWTALDRVCFSWMMSKSADRMDISSLESQEGELKNLDTLIDALENQKPRDMVGLLQSSSVAKFLDEESKGSPILTISTNVHEQLIVMRTGVGSKSRQLHEYFWTRSQGKVVFSADGLELRVTRKDGKKYAIQLHVRAKGADSGWIEVQISRESTVMQYLDHWYREELEELTEVWKLRTPILE